jgi:hypothetical protein
MDPSAPGGSTGAISGQLRDASGRTDAPILMATTSTPMKITDATMSADKEELQLSVDGALVRARGQLGQAYPMLIGSEERMGEQTFEDHLPIDTDIVVGPIRRARARRTRRWGETP